MIADSRHRLSCVQPVWDEDIYQKADVEDGETLEDVGEAGDQVHWLLVEHEHADDVAWQNIYIKYF